VRERIHTEKAPAAVGPYSQAIRAAGWIWASGQVALDPATGELVEGGVEEQTRRALDNLSAVLEAAGAGLDRVVRATVYLTDLGEFDTMNRVYSAYFGEVPPARVCVEVSRLPKGALVEIDAVAIS
jgi:2-iminobutanoate/2-iminopropanoate deaminase